MYYSSSGLWTLTLLEQKQTSVRFGLPD